MIALCNVGYMEQLTMKSTLTFILNDEAKMKSKGSPSPVTKMMVVSASGCEVTSVAGASSSNSSSVSYSNQGEYFTVQHTIFIYFLQLLCAIPCNSFGIPD